MSSSSSSSRFCSFDDPGESTVVLNSRQQGAKEFPLEPHDLILRMEVHFTSKDSTHMKRSLMKSWKRDLPMLHSHEIFVCFTLLPYMIYKVLGMLSTVARSAEAQNTRGCMRRRELTATIGGGLVGRIAIAELPASLDWHGHINKGMEPVKEEVFFDLENGNQELKSDVKDLYINLGQAWKRGGRSEERGGLWLLPGKR
ncbi:hypothetical protein TRIUR3_31361 [Triticum urartu]|uniref:Uncharacterized protein n=1 Tax=Triticum urartu TaxID=4572 RepID=M7ZFE1_TRIUA|nr:hypothetical protein TRIUR3_31361 [Triticum urartu]